jgi:hypothetical protein
MPAHLPAALLALALVALTHLIRSRERRYRRHAEARRQRRAERERQWRSMIRGDGA